MTPSSFSFSASHALPSGVVPPDARGDNIRQAKMNMEEAIVWR